MDIEKIIRLFRSSSRWGLVRGYFAAAGVCFAIIWGSIQFLELPSKLKEIGWFEFLLTTRWLTILSALACAGLLKLAIDLLFFKYQKGATEQTMNEYDAAYNDLVKCLSHALNRYSKYSDDLLDNENASARHVMDMITEAERARLRFLKVCGPKIHSLLQRQGHFWLSDVDTFATSARIITDELSEVAAEDRAQIQGVASKTPRPE